MPGDHMSMYWWDDWSRPEYFEASYDDPDDDEPTDEEEEEEEGDDHED